MKISERSPDELSIELGSFEELDLLFSVLEELKQPLKPPRVRDRDEEQLPLPLEYEYEG